MITWQEAAAWERIQISDDMVRSNVTKFSITAQEYVQFPYVTFLGLVHANRHWFVAEKRQSFQKLLEDWRHKTNTEVKVKQSPFTRWRHMHRGSRGPAPLILHLSDRWRWEVHVTPWPLYPPPPPPWIKSHLYPPNRWRTIWTIWRTEISFAPAGNTTPNRPTHNIVTILATLSWLWGCIICIL
jgi:hypothetical protein